MEGNILKDQKLNGKKGYLWKKYKKETKLKMTIVKKNKIPLKRIPYFELKDLTIEDILSDKFLVKGDE